MKYNSLRINPIWKFKIAKIVACASLLEPRYRSKWLGSTCTYQSSWTGMLPPSVLPLLEVTRQMELARTASGLDLQNWGKLWQYNYDRVFTMRHMYPVLEPFTGAINSGSIYFMLMHKCRFMINCEHGARHSLFRCLATLFIEFVYLILFCIN